MTLSNPRPLADLVELLKIKSVSWYPQRFDKSSGAGSGQYITTELAPSLWAADVAIRDLLYADGRMVRALINSVCRPGQTFYLYDPIGKYPASDPDGAILGSATVTIKAIGSDNTSLSFSGLPVGYRLGLGDYVQVDYGASLSRRALFELQEAGTAVLDGTPELRVYPSVPTGLVAGAPVTLKKPSVKVAIKPGSIVLGTAESLHITGMGFTALQKI